MLQTRHVALFFTVWMLQSALVSTFNLDTQNVMKKRGEADSLFGFSMAMHQLKPSDERVLLIGAPRATALPLHKANISGGLYRCKFTSKPDDCERIPVDIEARKERSGIDYREKQWLGVRVRSQGPGGKVVTCAHRYQDWVFDNQLVLGRCFVLDQNLDLLTEAESTRSFCKAREVDKRMFGYCQQGLSVAFSKDNNYLVSGGPGAYDWKGTVHMEPIDDFSLESYETGDQNTRREDLIPVGISSLLGFALDTGMNVLKRDELSVVAGAPRSNHSGEVLLLKPVEKGNTRSLRAEHILQGPGLASSFGYDLAVLDMNADGWDDLVVGAPQFSEKDMSEDVGGAVYVYINQAAGQNWKRIEPVCLYGKKDSMFGLAVAHTGDINQDGYQDFAVSAPYEDKGRSRVYIYHGSAEGFHQTPAQVLQASDPTIKLFGYSLAGNMDIDDNGYPDLAVGSLSDTVSVYRTKPIVNIEKTLTLKPNQIDFKTKDCKRSLCIVTAQTCFSYSAQPATYNPKLRVEYKLKADSLRRDRGLPARLVFVKPDAAQGNVELSGQNKRRCLDTQLKLLGDIQDKLTNISIDLSASLPPDSPKQTLRSFQSLEPVLNPLNEKMTKTDFMFMNDGCGHDNICQSNLQLHYSFCTRDPQQDNCIPLAKENGVAVISPGDENVALQVTVTNVGGDDAHQSQIALTFPEFLPLSAVVQKRNSEIEVQCDPNESKTQAECHLGNPFKRDSEVTFYLMLNMEKLSIKITSANVTMGLKTVSVQNAPTVVAEAKIIFEMQLEVFGVAKPSQLFFGGVKKNEKMKSEEDIGSLVLYEFRVSNIGRPLKSFASAVLNIHWPDASKHGERILYLVQITGRGQNTIPCTPSAAINPLRYETSTRERREAQQGSESGGSKTGFLTSFFGNKRKYKTLTCADELKCVEIKCPLQAVDSTALVILRARLWNNTFLQEYGSLNYLDIVLDASLSIDGTQGNIGIRPSETKVRLTVFPEKKPALLSRVPWWVILFSVLTTLLLLGLLFYLLQKLNCFHCGVCGGEKDLK